MWARFKVLMKILIADSWDSRLRALKDRLWDNIYINPRLWRNSLMAGDPFGDMRDEAAHRLWVNLALPLSESLRP